MVWSIGGNVPGFNGSYAGEKVNDNLGLSPIFGDSSYWNQPANYDQWANPVFGIGSSMGSSSQPSSGSDPFGGLANAFRSSGAAANPMAGFSMPGMIAGAMAMREIGDSKRRMVDAYWNRAGNEMRKEFMVDDLFNIAPLAEQQKQNLEQRRDFADFPVNQYFSAKQDRMAMAPGMNPLGNMIPRNRLNTPYGIG